MKRDHTTSSRDIDLLIERQLRNWEIARSQEGEGPVAAGVQPVESFITLSRAVGLPGDEIARRLHERTGWPVFDREILAAMADSDELRQQVYAYLDDRDINWVEDFVLSMNERAISRENYFHRLTETVSALARKCHAVFLGRGADLILPRDVGLRVRLTASHDYCVRTFAASNNLKHEYALRQFEEIEAERTRFIKNHFGVDPGDPTRFDLILNIERLNVAKAVDIILAAADVKGVLEHGVTNA